MNRVIAAGPIVWLGIIITTCLLLVVFQTVLWLVMPVLLAVVANYMLSPLVTIAMARGVTRSRAVFMVTVILTLLIVGIGFEVAPKVTSFAHDLPANIGKYAATANKLVENARKTFSTMCLS